MICPVNIQQAMLPEDLISPKRYKSKGQSLQQMGGPYSALFSDTKPVLLVKNVTAEDLFYSSCKTPSKDYTPSTMATDLDPLTPTFTRVIAKVSRVSICAKESLHSIKSIDCQSLDSSDEDLMPGERKIDLVQQNQAYGDCELSVESLKFSIEQEAQHKPIMMSLPIFKTSLEQMVEEIPELDSVSGDLKALPKVCDKSSVSHLEADESDTDKSDFSSLTDEELLSDHSFSLLAKKASLMRLDSDVHLPQGKLLARSVSTATIRSTIAVSQVSREFF